MLVLPATALAGLTRAESSVLRELNRVRAQHGLCRLRVDPHLERAAAAHTSEMLRSNLFSHGAFATRLLRFNVNANTIGENLAWGTGAQGSARSIVAAWLASPEHRANLLGPVYRRIGVGELTGPFQGLPAVHLVTADFAG